MIKKTVKTKVFRVCHDTKTSECGLEFILSEKIFDAKLNDYIGSVTLDFDETYLAFERAGYTKEHIYNIFEDSAYNRHVSKAGFIYYDPISLPNLVEIELEVYNHEFY
jgi:hypothetical protein